MPTKEFHNQHCNIRNTSIKNQSDIAVEKEEFQPEVKPARRRSRWEQLPISKHNSAAAERVGQERVKHEVIKNEIVSQKKTLQENPRANELHSAADFNRRLGHLKALPRHGESDHPQANKRKSAIIPEIMQIAESSSKQIQAVVVEDSALGCNVSPKVVSKRTKSSKPVASSLTPKRQRLEWGQGLASNVKSGEANDSRRPRLGWGMGLMRTPKASATAEKSPSSNLVVHQDKNNVGENALHKKDTLELKPVPAKGNSSCWGTATLSQPSSLPKSEVLLTQSADIAASDISVKLQEASPRMTPSIQNAISVDPASVAQQRENLLFDIEKIDRTIANVESSIAMEVERLRALIGECPKKRKRQHTVNTIESGGIRKKIQVQMDSKLKKVCQHVLYENQSRQAAAVSEITARMVPVVGRSANTHATILAKNFMLVSQPVNFDAFSNSIASDKTVSLSVVREAVLRHVQFKKHSYFRDSILLARRYESYRQGVFGPDEAMSKQIDRNLGTKHRTATHPSTIDLKDSSNAQASQLITFRGSKLLSSSDVVRSEYEHQKVLESIADEQRRDKRLQNTVSEIPDMESTRNQYFGLTCISENYNRRNTTDGNLAKCMRMKLGRHACTMGQYCNCSRVVEWRRQFSNPWADVEKCIFIDKFLQYPKNFSKISSFLTRKTTSECVEFYYSTKYRVKYKELLHQQAVRRRATTNLKSSIAAGSLIDTTTTRILAWAWCIASYASSLMGVQIPQRMQQKLILMNQGPQNIETIPMLNILNYIHDNSYSMPTKAYRNFYFSPSLSSHVATLNRTRQPDGQFRTGKNMDDSYPKKRRKRRSSAKPPIVPLLTQDKGQPSNRTSGSTQCYHPKFEDQHLVSSSCGGEAGYHYLPDEVTQSENYYVGADEYESASTETIAKATSLQPADNDDVEISVKPSSLPRRTVQKWTEKEKAEFLQLFSVYGKDWVTLTTKIGTKTAAQIKNYYQNYKNRLGLATILQRRNNRLTAASDLLGGIKNDADRTYSALDDQRRTSEQKQVGDRKSLTTDRFRECSFIGPRHSVDVPLASRSLNSAISAPSPVFYPPDVDHGLNGVRAAQGVRSTSSPEVSTTPVNINNSPQANPVNASKQRQLVNLHRQIQFQRAAAAHAHAIGQTSPQGNEAFVKGSQQPATQGSERQMHLMHYQMQQNMQIMQIQLQRQHEARRTQLNANAGEIRHHIREENPPQRRNIHPTTLNSSSVSNNVPILSNIGNVVAVQNNEFEAIPSHSVFETTFVDPRSSANPQSGPPSTSRMSFSSILNHSNADSATRESIIEPCSSASSLAVPRRSNVAGNFRLQGLASSIQFDPKESTNVND